MPENQNAAIPVTERLLEAWSVQADVCAPLIRPGEINWVMMTRSLIAEIRRLQATS